MSIRCRVCLRPWTSQNSKLVATKCGHMFCRECVSESGSCPICRTTKPLKLVPVVLDVPESNELNDKIKTEASVIPVGIGLHNIRVFMKMQQECPICLEPVFSTTRKIKQPVVSKCGHVFHQDCFLTVSIHDEEWKCPMCRVAVDPNSIRCLHIC